MIVEVPVRGYFEENCYFFIDDATRHGFVIDPGAQAHKLLELIDQNGWTIEKILLTHGHFDHFGAAAALKKALGTPICAHELAPVFLRDPRLNLSALCGQAMTISESIPLGDGDTIALAADPAFSLTVLHTPGHTPDSVTYWSKKENAAFVGDTIFKGSAGLTRFPGGDASALRRSIAGTIFALPPATVLYSGHSEPTAVGAEMS